MITKISYRPYNSSISNGQSQSQNVNFGTKLDQNTLRVGSDFANDLLNLTTTPEPFNHMTNMLQRLRNGAGETMTVKELMEGIEKTRLFPRL